MCEKCLEERRKFEYGGLYYVKRNPDLSRRPISCMLDHPGAFDIYTIDFVESPIVVWPWDR